LKISDKGLSFFTSRQILQTRFWRFTSCRWFWERDRESLWDL